MLKYRWKGLTTAERRNTQGKENEKLSLRSLELQRDPQVAL